MNNNKWMSIGSTSIPIAETRNKNKQKRDNQSEQEQLLRKKQAIVLVKGTSSGSDPNLNGGSWHHNLFPQMIPQTFAGPTPMWSYVGNEHHHVPASASTSRNIQEINFLHQLENNPSKNNNFEGPTYSTTSGNTISVPPSLGDVNVPYTPYVGQSLNRGYYNNVNMIVQNPCANFMTMSQAYGNGYMDLFSVNPYYNGVNQELAPLNSFAHNYGNSSATPVTFNDPQPNYGVLVNQSFAQGVMHGTAFSQSNENVVGASTSMTEDANHSKEKKTTKKPRNGDFPINVKSLLSTGFLDGVPVKYVSWSREKSLRGVVKGLGYLCSCENCKFSKSVNADEFEVHAGCKTKHPNNHIYFENGKSIYAVVQELRATPRDKLFDVIPNVTGSTINHKNFLKWQASFQTGKPEASRDQREE